MIILLSCDAEQQDTDPLWQLERFPRPLSHNMGPTSKGRAGDREKGGEERDGEGRRKAEKEKGRERRDRGGRMRSCGRVTL